MPPEANTEELLDTLDNDASDASEQTPAPRPTRRRRRRERPPLAEQRIKFEGPAGVLLNAGGALDDDEDSPWSIRPSLLADQFIEEEPEEVEEEEAEASGVEAELLQLQKQNELKARVYGLPRLFAERNPSLSKLPKPQPPGTKIMFDNLPYAGQAELEAYVQAKLPFGYYLVEVRRKGKFAAGFSVHHLPPETLDADGEEKATAHLPGSIPFGNLAALGMHPYEPPHPVEPADPVKEARAQTMIMQSVVNAATKLLSAQPQTSAPTLKERLAELKMLQEMFAPARQPEAPPSNKPDPIERLAETLQSEAFKQVVAFTKTSNPVEAVAAEPGTSIWDFLSPFADSPAVQQGLGVLLTNLGMAIGNYFGADAAQPVQSPQPTQRSPRAPLPAAQPQTQGVTLEMVFNDILAMLRNNDDPAQAAAKLHKLAKVFPPAKMAIQQYATAANDDIIAALIEISGVDPEAFEVEWRDEWLDGLKAALAGGQA